MQNQSAIHGNSFATMTTAPTAVQAQPETPLEALYAQLEKMVNHLGGRVDHLSQRLDPVMRPTVPAGETAQASTNQPQPARSQYADRFAYLSTIVESITARVDEVHSRLEL